MVYILMALVFLPSLFCKSACIFDMSFPLEKFSLIGPSRLFLNSSNLIIHLKLQICTFLTIYKCVPSLLD